MAHSPRGRSAAAVKGYGVMCGWRAGWGAAWDVGVSESRGVGGSSSKNRNLTSSALFTSDVCFPFKKYLLHCSCMSGTLRGAGGGEPDMVSAHSNCGAALHCGVASALPGVPLHEKGRADPGLETVGHSGALGAS